MNEVDILVKENERLLRGDFTAEEFQRICHNLEGKPGLTRCEFEAGCRAYQDKLFGTKRVDR